MFDWISWNKENGQYDVLNPWCGELVKAMYARDVKIIFLSARTDDGGIRSMTEDWIDLNLPEIADYELVLRQKDDYSGDPVCKMGLYYTFVAPTYEVIFAIDDTVENCSMWRNLGIVALHCADY